ncbi:cysteine-rich venom protein pseudechetoxin-like [Watersipora subatra]|uniref:cysteine-rich venom protein pseudechetoxin-like n=1 Tax=Watersipora subatra TaxID=2589382 RepID=UPI00355B03B2
MASLWDACEILLVSSAAKVSTSGALDERAEKFFHFSKKHTASITKSKTSTSSGVSEPDKRIIVNKHNQLRSSQGAGDMQKMVWDDEIASIAQRWADNCKNSHDEYRAIPGRFSVGQNLAWGYKTWDGAMQAWYDEVDDFTYGSESANRFSAVGHYTQMVWASSAKIGCGYAYCTNLNAEFYVCNYGPAGNYDWWIPYKAGPPCGDCSNTCDSDKLCDCNGKVCENGGTLTLNTCECTCSKKWNNPGTCGLNCTAVEEPTSCERGGFYHGKCQKWSNVPDECPNMCNICPYAGLGYNLAVTATYSTFLLFSLQFVIITCSP